MLCLKYGLFWGAGEGVGTENGRERERERFLCCVLSGVSMFESKRDEK